MIPLRTNTYYNSQENYMELQQTLLLLYLHHAKLQILLKTQKVIFPVSTLPKRANEHETHTHGQPEIWNWESTNNTSACELQINQGVQLLIRLSNY